MTRHLAWLAVSVMASCQFELPKAVSGDAPDVPLDGPPQFTSCMGLAMTCGAGANESCCRAATVSGGTFYRSYDLAPDMAYSDISYPATVSTFVLDSYEVTVGRFRAFVNAGLGTLLVRIR